jgi:hypothetical protein
MVLFTGNEKSVTGDLMGKRIDSDSSIQRVEPLLTADKLKSRFLFGIPLYSMEADPITHKRRQMTDDDLVDQINLAITDAEDELHIAIQPVEAQTRLPYDKNQWKGLNPGYIQIPSPHRPVSKIIEMKATLSDSNSSWSWTVPLEWIDLSNSQKGQISVIPFSATISTLNYDSTTAIDQTGNWLGAGVVGNLPFWPSFWQIKLIAGFNMGEVPNIINNLIGNIAASKILSMLQATNRIQNFSVAIDAASQSIDTGGPTVYNGRINELKEQREKLVSRIRTLFGSRYAIGNI